MAAGGREREEGREEEREGGRPSLDSNLNFSYE